MTTKSDEDDQSDEVITVLERLLAGLLSHLTCYSVGNALVFLFFPPAQPNNICTGIYNIFLALSRYRL